MTWQEQHQIRKNPEQILIHKQKAESFDMSWTEKWMSISEPDMHKKLSNLSANEISKLRKLDPDNQAEMVAFANEIGDDELILAKVASYLQLPNTLPN